MPLSDNVSLINTLDDLTYIRRRRVIQISAATGIGLLTSLFVARGFAFNIFLIGFISLAVSGSLAYRNHVTASSYVLLGSMSLMLFAANLKNFIDLPIYCIIIVVL